MCISRPEATHVRGSLAPQHPDSESALPRIERQIVIKVESMMEYRRGPHTDRPLEPVNEHDAGRSGET